MIGTRLAVVAVIVVAALVAAWLARRGVVVRRRRVSFPGHAPGLMLFSSSTCDSCLVVEATLRDVVGTGGFEPVAFEDDPESFDLHKVDGVPTIVWVGPDGTGWSAAGIPSRRRLERWLA